MNWKSISILTETGGNLDLVTALQMCIFMEEITHRGVVNCYLNPEEGEEVYRELQERISTPRRLVWEQIEETLEETLEEKERREELREGILSFEEKSREYIRSLYSTDGDLPEIDWDSLLRKIK